MSLHRPWPPRPSTPSRPSPLGRRRASPSAILLAAARWPAGRFGGGTRAQLSTAPVPDARPRRVGVMGGTFDPIHHGHLVAASEVQAWFDLDEVVFVPTGDPWQKSDREVSPAEHRYLMTVIATAANPRFNVSRVDIDRDGPTYTIDTLRDLKATMPDAELYFITGADALADIFTWRDAEELFELAHFVGCTRPGYAMDADDARRDPGRPGDDGRDPGAGDLLDRLPRAQAARRAGLVPRARRRRAVHRQARPLPLQQGHPVTATDHALELVARRRARRLRQARPADHRLRRQRAARDHRRLPARLAPPTTARSRRSSTRSRTSSARSAPSRSAARASATGAGCSSTTATSSCTSSTRRSGQFYALERLWRDCPSIALPADVVSHER